MEKYFGQYEENKKKISWVMFKKFYVNSERNCGNILKYIIQENLVEFQRKFSENLNENYQDL